MSGTWHTIRSEAEQVVEYLGLSVSEDVDAVETLVDDPLFQETAVAYHRIDLLESYSYETGLAPETEAVVEDVEAARERLLSALRGRAADLLDVEQEVDA
jgi:hypothetical protein